MKRVDGSFTVFVSLGSAMLAAGLSSLAIFGIVKSYFLVSGRVGPLPDLLFIILLNVVLFGLATWLAYLLSSVSSRRRMVGLAIDWLIVFVSLLFLILSSAGVPGAPLVGLIGLGGSLLFKLLFLLVAALASAFKAVPVGVGTAAGYRVFNMGLERWRRRKQPTSADSNSPGSH